MRTWNTTLKTFAKYCIRIPTMAIAGSLKIHLIVFVALDIILPMGEVHSMVEKCYSCGNGYCEKGTVGVIQDCSAPNNANCMKKVYPDGRISKGCSNEEVIGIWEMVGNGTVLVCDSNNCNGGRVMKCYACGSVLEPLDIAPPPLCEEGDEGTKDVICPGAPVRGCIEIVSKFGNTSKGCTDKGSTGCLTLPGETVHYCSTDNCNAIGPSEENENGASCLQDWAFIQILFVSLISFIVCYK